MPDAKIVTIVSEDPNITLSALLDQAGATITGGYGSWEVIPRPNRQGVTHWTGRSPFTMSLAIILDGHAQGESVETPCSRLERLALPDSKTGVPPVVKISSRAVPHRDLEWVVENIEWGDSMRNEGGYRTRQFAVISLIRYVEIDKIQVTAAANARGKATATVRTVNVKQGDTLAKISARELGNSNRWHEIKNLNPNIGDPNNLKGIDKVKIPSKTAKK